MTRTLDQITTLYSGKHDPNGKKCVMESVAWLAGEPRKRKVTLDARPDVS